MSIATRQLLPRLSPATPRHPVVRTGQARDDGSQEFGGALPLPPRADVFPWVMFKPPTATRTIEIDGVEFEVPDGVSIRIIR